MKRIVAMLFLLALLCGVIPLAACAKADFDGIAVEVLDVGQSDCTLITVDGFTVLIDSGTVTERHSVQAALERLDVSHIDYLILTHAHEDHVGNARMLLECYTVGAVLAPPSTDEVLEERLAKETAAKQGVTWQIAEAGQSIPLGRAVVDVLLADPESENLNNGSMVLTVTFGNVRFLFTGDNEAEGEQRLLETVPPERLRSDFLKAGHHGSANATGEALLRVVRPTQVAFSCGLYNGYGFPSEAVLERLRAIGAEWHRTDTEGDLRYVSDGERIWLEA